MDTFVRGGQCLAPTGRKNLVMPILYPWEVFVFPYLTLKSDLFILGIDSIHKPSKDRKDN